MYNFKQWVSTPENRSARLAVDRVTACVCSRRPRREINPLVLHGPAGTGKTHLASALAAEVIRQCPDLAVALLPAGELNPTADDTLAARDSDLLVVEDLQHLRDPAVETLVQMLDDRLARQQQTVVTAVVGPRRLTQLPARLTSRLAAGLVVGLEPLAPASRLIFLQDRLARRQLAVGGDVLAWLAEHAGGSGRQLEGAVARLEALTRLHGRLPDLAAVAAHFHADAVAPTVERIVQRVGACFQVEPRQIVARHRRRSALLPRQVGMYLARRLTPLSLGQIGAYFGGRDHTTVLHACRKVERALVSDAVLSGAVRQLHADLA